MRLRLIALAFGLSLAALAASASSARADMFCSGPHTNGPDEDAGKDAGKSDGAVGLGSSKMPKRAAGGGLVIAAALGWIWRANRRLG